MTGRTLGLALLAGFPLIATGCSLIASDARVELRLPAPPEQWRGLASSNTSAGAVGAYRIRAPGRDGDPACDLTVTAGGGTVQLTLPKRANLPVLAYPVFEDRIDLLKPAGGIFPLDASAPGATAVACLTLSWAHGFLAEVLFALAQRGSFSKR